MKQCLVDAHAAGIKIIPDCHAYGRRDGRIATPAELADLWGKLAAEIKNEPALEAYDIMNEPHDMGADSVWYNMAEAAIIAIRRHDTVRKIHVAGDYWSGAWHWSGHLLPLFKKYPNLVAHAHQYLDPNGSGTYGDGSYTAPSPDIGVERIRPFVEWCKANNVEGFIGEFGVPGHIDPRWHEAQKRMLDYMVANKIGGTIWAGGAWWWSGYLLRMGAPGEETHPNFAAIRPYLSPVEAPAPTPVPVPPTPTPPTPTPPAPIVIPDVLPKRLLLALAENAVTLLQGRTTRAQLLTMTTQLRDGLKN